MTISLLMVLSIILAHWISDFVFQSDWMARNKSKSNRALLAHVLVYTASIAVILALLPSGLLTHGLYVYVRWVLINGALHFATDYVTSRITSRLYAENRIHDFFVVVGFDQMMHYMLLLTTAALLA